MVFHWPYWQDAIKGRLQRNERSSARTPQCDQPPRTNVCFCHSWMMLMSPLASASHFGYCWRIRMGMFAEGRFCEILGGTISEIADNKEEGKQPCHSKHRRFHQFRKPRRGRLVKTFPRGNRYMAMRDELGVFYSDQTFAALFPVRGQPAEDSVAIGADSGLSVCRRDSRMSRQPRQYVVVLIGNMHLVWS